MTVDTYKQDEIARHHAQCERTRREFGKSEYHKDEWLKAMSSDPELVAERVGWVLNGSYGYGAYLLSGEVARNKRMNRPANLVQMAGILEWLQPEETTRKIWNSMDKAQQDALNHAVNAEINAFLEVYEDREAPRPD
jgi:hypothetical protein